MTSRPQWGRFIFMYDLGILGAGSAGIAAAYVASTSGKLVAVFEAGHSPDFSSVRNQGWLHSGALYALQSSDISSIAQDCGKAFADITTLAGELSPASVGAKKGVAFFEDEVSVERMISAAEINDIYARRLSLRETEEVFSIYGRSPLHRYGVEISDTYIHNHSFLGALVRQCKMASCDFINVSGFLEGLELDWKGSQGGWRIIHGDNEHFCRNLLVCLGPLIPEFVSRHLEMKLIHKIKSCHVAAVRVKAIDRIMISPSSGTSFINLAPCRSGFTVNCGALDANSDSAMPEGVDSRSVFELSRLLRIHWPKLAEMIISEPVVHYICKKLEIAEPAIVDRRRVVLEEPVEKLHYFYPGKFTTMLEGARTYYESVFGELPKENISRRGPSVVPRNFRGVVDFTKRNYDLRYQHPVDAHGQVAVPFGQL